MHSLGIELLSSESIESYSWLLDVVILQAVPAVYSRIQDIDCLGSHMTKIDVLKKFSGLIWNETILKEDFESTWKNLMDEFHLNENNWFNKMYKIRDLWVPSYFKECTFSGLMRTTSRSKTENYFYWLLSNLDLHLIEFSFHFDTTLEGKRCIQRKNDHDSRYTKPDFKTGLKL
ncbi:protein FAR1-RELATED SEQUENCE 4-like [Lactuca sativa]|uniref:Protein FAR1-RELATED SEQUENCE n=1 Tax=Lactuca sativa TaxID=4236 RepID=A0A9R1UJF1_LACSA|nr:protein FAR1-RELATED SEQUENCE 4-like [Lactuca sativa]KAJ0188264.1 hypothetical protein LSAT_V11C900498270 [Lactuca sativa]